MGGAIYSEAELMALRASPLVTKPERLPSITQWMDVLADQNNNNQNNNARARRVPNGIRPAEGDTANERPPVINPMGQFGRRQSMQPGEDTVLGPPKFNFASASRMKAGETKERTGIVSTDGDNLGDRFPREKSERWTRGGDAERNRDKGYTNGRRPAREEGDGWTVAKGRKSVGQEDFERFGGRNGDRNRDKQEGDPEAEAAPRRGNRDRAEPRWGRRDETKEEGIKLGMPGGWRERDQNRDRDRDRDWTRGGNRAEEDPEWMDTKVEKKEKVPHTQEEFQRWKEQMRAKDTSAKDKDERMEMPSEMSTAISATVPPMLTQPLHTPSTEPTQGILFGNWGRDTAAESPAEAIAAKPKTDKKSRFMNMFAKPEEAAAPSQPPIPTPASPPPPSANADQEGFQRILQMLGQVNVGGPPPAQPSAPAPPANGARHGGGISLDFHQQSPPPESQANRPVRTLEQQSILDNILNNRPTPESRPSQQSRFNSMSPDNVMHEQFRLPRGEPNHPEEHFAHQQPSRGGLPDANLSAILQGRARVEARADPDTKQKERDFLLTLMQQPSRATPPQLSNHNLPRPNQENNLAAFFDHQPRQQPQAPPKGRTGLPPGFMEDPRMFNENDMTRREAERREQEIRQQHIMQQQQQQDAMRAKNARLPMGFPGHEDTIMGLQRRTTAGDSRQMTNMGIPSQPVTDMSYMSGRGQPGMPPTPQDRPNIGPPPGFGGGPMRQPPGLNGPNPQQQMGPGPSFSAGNTPLGHPPGFPPPGNMRGMPAGFPGNNGMQGGPPQGYFPPHPPPGYGPMGGMPREDPRIMFEGGHAGFAAPGSRQQQQQGRPGPPGMY